MPPRRILGRILRYSLPLLFAAVACTIDPGWWRPPRYAAEVYDPVTDEWSRARKLPLRLAGTQCIGIGGFVYVIGGSDLDAEETHHLLRFDPRARTWEELNDIPSPRCGHRVVALGTDICVLGGYSAPRSLEIFDTITGTWSVAPEMPSPHSSCGAAQVGGRIYVMGGAFHPWGGTGISDLLEVFDPASGTWQALAPMPVPLWDFTAETDGAFIYVIGGRTSDVLWSPSTDEVRLYDPASDLWTGGPPMPVAGNYLKSAVIGREVFVVGAFGIIDDTRYGFGEERRRILAFDPFAGSWREPAPKPWEMFDVGVAAEGGLLYVFGGRDRRVRH